jgi:hypothetical protein
MGVRSDAIEEQHDGPCSGPGQQRPDGRAGLAQPLDPAQRRGGGAAGVCEHVRVDDRGVRGNQAAPGGAAWALANAGALVSLALFTLAAWAVFTSRPWWERAAAAGAIIGLAALVPYGIAASSTGVSGPGLNSAIHIAGSAAVLLVLLVPALDRRLRAWLSGTGRPRKR